MARETKFFIKLPEDTYHNSPKLVAVVEARTEVRDGEEWLIPVAPTYVAKHWRAGWPRNQGRGWYEGQEITGPARMLSERKYKQLLDILPDEVQKTFMQDFVELGTSALISKNRLYVTVVLLRILKREHPTLYHEFVRLCYRPHYHISDAHRRQLLQDRLIGDNGQPDATMRRIVRTTVKINKATDTIAAASHA